MSKTLHNIWIRLSDRNKIPRCLWFPPKRNLDLDTEEWQRQHDEVSATLRRAMLTLLGYSFFCLITLGGSDVSLVAKDAVVRLPFAGTEVHFISFLALGSLVLLVLTIYLHIFVGYLLAIGPHKDTLGLPFIFNIKHRLANSLADFIFYWLPCIVLIKFAAKAMPQPEAAAFLTVLAAVGTASLAWLKIRRCGDNRRGLKVLILWLLFCLSLWIAVIQLKVGIERPLFNRELYLPHADLSNKDLNGVNMVKAVLQDADLQGSNLESAILDEAILYKAKLQGSNLKMANLQGADLRKANLKNTCLEGADLEGADLRLAKGLTCEQIKKSRNWEQAYRDTSMACGEPIPKKVLRKAQAP